MCVINPCMSSGVSKALWVNGSVSLWRWFWCHDPVSLCGAPAFSAFHRNAPITEAQARRLLGFWENNPSFPGESDSRAACGTTCVNTSADNRPECGVNSSARHRRSTSRPPGQQRRRPGVAALFPNCRNPGHPFTHFKRLQLPDGGLTNAP